MFKAKSTEGVNGDVSEKTDLQGRFSLRIIKGLKWQISSGIFGSADTFENCPKFEELVKQSEESWTEIHSEAVEITAETDIHNLVVCFPFPKCRRKERDE